MSQIQLWLKSFYSVALVQTPLTVCFLLLRFDCDRRRIVSFFTNVNIIGNEGETR